MPSPLPHPRRRALTGLAISVLAIGGLVAVVHGRTWASHLETQRNAALARHVQAVFLAITDLEMDDSVQIPTASTLEAKLFRVTNPDGEPVSYLPGRRMPPNPWSATGEPSALVCTNAFPIHRVFPGWARPAHQPGEAPADPLAAPWLDPRVRQPGTIIYHFEAASGSAFVFGVGEQAGRPAIVAREVERAMNYPAEGPYVSLEKSERVLRQMGVLRRMIVRWAQARDGRYPTPGELRAALFPPDRARPQERRYAVKMPPNPWSPGEPMALVATDAFPIHRAFRREAAPPNQPGVAPQDPLAAPWLDPRVRRPGTIIYHHVVRKNDFYLLDVAPDPEDGKPKIAHWMWHDYHRDPDWMPVDP